MSNDPRQRIRSYKRTTSALKSNLRNLRNLWIEKLFFVFFVVK